MYRWRKHVKNTAEPRDWCSSQTIWWIETGEDGITLPTHCARILEHACLQLLKAIRVGIATLYVKIIWELRPWMFPLESHNHAICPSVHNRASGVLPINHLHIYEDICNGSSVEQKTKRLFLSLTLDHAHEKGNAVVKKAKEVLPV